MYQLSGTDMTRVSVYVTGSIEPILTADFSMDTPWHLSLNLNRLLLMCGIGSATLEVSGPLGTSYRTILTTPSS